MVSHITRGLNWRDKRAMWGGGVTANLALLVVVVFFYIFRAFVAYYNRSVFLLRFFQMF